MVADIISNNIHKWSSDGKNSGFGCPGQPFLALIIVSEEVVLFGEVLCSYDYLLSRYSDGVLFQLSSHTAEPEPDLK